MLGRSRKFCHLQNGQPHFGGYTPASVLRGIRILSQQPSSKVNYLPPSSAKVKNDWYCSSVARIRIHCVDKDIFTLLCFLFFFYYDILIVVFICTLRIQRKHVANV